MYRVANAVLESDYLRRKTINLRDLQVSEGDLVLLVNNRLPRGSNLPCATFSRFRKYLEQEDDPDCKLPEEYFVSELTLEINTPHEILGVNGENVGFVRFPNVTAFYKDRNVYSIAERIYLGHEEIIKAVKSDPVMIQLLGNWDASQKAVINFA